MQSNSGIGFKRGKMKKYLRSLSVSLLILFTIVQYTNAQNSQISFTTGDSSFINLKGTWTISNYIELYDSEDIATPIAFYQFNSETAYYLVNGFSAVQEIYIPFTTSIDQFDIE